MIELFELVELMEAALPVKNNKSKGGYTQILPGEGYVRLHWVWFKHIDTIPRSHSLIVSKEDRRDIGELIEQAAKEMRKL